MGVLVKTVVLLGKHFYCKDAQSLAYYFARAPDSLRLTGGVSSQIET